MINRAKRKFESIKMLSPTDLSFIRSPGPNGSNRAHSAPSALMQMDSYSNFSQHTGGLSQERSPGLFFFADVGGEATFYLLWRRSESHALISHSLSLEDGVWSPDRMPTPKAASTPNIVGGGYFAPRLHAVNSDGVGSTLVADWKKIGYERAPGGLDLVVALSGDKKVARMLIDEQLKEGGCAVISEKMHDKGIETRFNSVYYGGGMVVLVGRGKKRTPKVNNVDILEGGSDPLLLWIECNA